MNRLQLSKAIYLKTKVTFTTKNESFCYEEKTFAFV